MMQIINRSAQLNNQTVLQYDEQQNCYYLKDTVGNYYQVQIAIPDYLDKLDQYFFNIKERQCASCHYKRKWVGEEKACASCRYFSKTLKQKVNHQQSQSQSQSYPISQVKHLSGNKRRYNENYNHDHHSEYKKVKFNDENQQQQANPISAQELQKLQILFGQLKDQLTLKQNEIKKLKDKEAENHKINNRMIDQHISEKELLKKDNFQLTQKVSGKENQNTAENENLKKQINFLTEQLNKIEETHKKNNENIQNLSKHNQQLKDQLQEEVKNSENIQNLKDFLKSSQEQLKASNKEMLDHKSKQSQFDGQIKEKDQKIKTLQSDNSQVKKQLQEEQQKNILKEKQINNESQQLKTQIVSLQSQITTKNNDLQKCEKLQYEAVQQKVKNEYTLQQYEKSNNELKTQLQIVLTQNKQNDLKYADYTQNKSQLSLVQKQLQQETVAARENSQKFVDYQGKLKEKNTQLTKYVQEKETEIIELNKNLQKQVQQKPQPPSNEGEIVALKKKSEEDQLVLAKLNKKYNEAILKNDLWRFENKNLISGDLINRYISLLQLNNREIKAQTTDIYSSYIKMNKKISQEKINYEEQLIPIFWNDNHWLLVFFRKNKKEFYYADSLYNPQKEPQYKNLCNSIRQYLDPSSGFYDIKRLNIYQQTNDYDCGICVIDNIRLIMTGQITKLAEIKNTVELRKKFSIELATGKLNY